MYVTLIHPCFAELGLRNNVSYQPVLSFSLQLRKILEASPLQKKKNKKTKKTKNKLANTSFSQRRVSMGGRRKSYFIIRYLNVLLELLPWAYGICEK